MPVLESVIGQHFAFASGRIGVLQQLLLTQGDVDRLLGAHSGREVEQILRELKMTSIIDQGVTKGEKVLDQVASWIRKEVADMAPLSKQPTFSILWLEDDLPLLSYLLKERHSLTSPMSQQPTAGMGSIEPERLRALLEKNEASALPTHLVELVRTVAALQNPTPQQIDTAVATYGASVRLRLARSSGSTHILRYVQHLIDLSNIRTALRFVEEAKETVLPLLLEGGTIDRNALAGDRKTVQVAIDRSDLYQLSDLVESGDSVALERRFSDVLAADIAAMWNVPLSIEPVFAFAAIAGMQLRLLRALLMGKRNELSPQEIKQILPPFLSASHYVL